MSRSGPLSPERLVNMLEDRLERKGLEMTPQSKIIAKKKMKHASKNLKTRVDRVHWKSKIDIGLDFLVEDIKMKVYQERFTKANVKAVNFAFERCRVWPFC